MHHTKLIVISVAIGFLAFPAHGQVHENGIGPDPDNDTNPATITGVIKRYNEPSPPSVDAPYTVVNFEPPPGKHGETVRNDYAEKYGVRFGRGVTRQICDGQRRFYYDSMCTYEAAPSGEFALGYVNYLNAPLLIEFDQPVCVVTMAIYPTGGNEGEKFTVTIEGEDGMGTPLPPASTSFEWTKNTVRWRHMAGAYYLGGRAKNIRVSMVSDKRRPGGDVLRFLIDDLAFVHDSCNEVIKEFSDPEIISAGTEQYDAAVIASDDQ